MKEIEVFPKQESLSSTGQIGNMVWLPFYGGVDDIGDGAQNGYTIFIDSQDGIPSLKTMNELDIEDEEYLHDLIDEIIHVEGRWDHIFIV